MIVVLAGAAFAGDGVVVHGTARTHHPYCGGASPSPEMAAGAWTPDAGVTFVVTAGSTHTDARPVATFRTDASGAFSLTLPPGQYCVVPEARGPAPTSAPPGADLACLVAQWRTCAAVADVKGAPVSLAIDTHRPCSWNPLCGPMGPPPP